LRDTFWNGFYPFIDYSSGGSIDGMIKAAEANVVAVSDKTIVIPSHNMPGHASPVSNKAELASFRSCSSSRARPLDGRPQEASERQSSGTGRTSPRGSRTPAIAARTHPRNVRSFAARSEK
jgi:hypothetical protein